MKQLALKIINKFILYPVYVKYCSQSIYRTLWGCLLLWDHTKDFRWQHRARKLCSILLSIQGSDGGFDNGYDYNFGRFHKKGEAIAPELTALIVLVEYYKRFNGEDVKIAIFKAAEWIEKYAFQISEDKWAIPYGPYSSKEVIVYNGTSFAASALGVYLSQFPNEKMRVIYNGMTNYLYGVMSKFSDQPGKFWYYSDRSRSDLTVAARNKIDYYHQMQQAECHAFAELATASPWQKEIVKESVEHIAYKQNRSGVIPYYNTIADVHMWGYCSCANGFIMASKLQPLKSSEYTFKAKNVIDWIVKYSWNGEYFYPIIDANGIVKDRRFYVRSDAWVFNTFALAIKEKILDDSYISFCELNYTKMESVNFSGVENHATNARIRLVRTGLSSLVNLIRSWRK